MKYTMKSVDVEAFQIPEDDASVSFPSWLTSAVLVGNVTFDAARTASFLNAAGVAEMGDYIVRDEIGSVFPMKKDKFEASYVPVK